MERLKVALLGLADVGAEYLEAIRADDQFDLVAVGDHDPNVLRRHAVDASCRVFEDYRSLVIETAHAGLDALIVALEPHESLELMELAGSRGVAVFHKPPPVRTLREAQRLNQWFETGGSALAIPRFWRTTTALSSRQHAVELAGHFVAAMATVWTTATSEGWRGDSVRAGGGVLLHGAYEIIDLLVWLLGLPDTVYTQCGVARAPGPPKRYDTEDVATLSLGFGDGRMASIAALRGAPEARRQIVLTGTDALIELDLERITVRLQSTGASETTPLAESPPAAGAIGAFGDAMRSTPDGLRSIAPDVVRVLAVIEAAYLSAKTGEPESPGRLLQS